MINILSEEHQIQILSSKTQENLLAEQKSFMWLRGYIHTQHTNKVSHKTAPSPSSRVNNHKNRPRRVARRAWQAFTYDLLLRGETQIKDGVRQKMDKKGSWHTCEESSFIKVRQLFLHAHTAPCAQKRSRINNKSAYLCVRVCLCSAECEPDSSWEGRQWQFPLTWKPASQPPQKARGTEKAGKMSLSSGEWK